MMMTTTTIHDDTDSQNDNDNDFDNDVNPWQKSYVLRSAMAPTPRVENFEDMGAQRHKPVYAPSFPFPGVPNPANLDPKVVTNIICHSSNMPTFKQKTTLSGILTTCFH